MTTSQVSLYLDDNILSFINLDDNILSSINLDDNISNFTNLDDDILGFINLNDNILTYINLDDILTIINLDVDTGLAFCEKHEFSQQKWLESLDFSVFHLCIHLRNLRESKWDSADLSKRIFLRLHSRILAKILS